MCAVSMIIDHGTSFPNRYPDIFKPQIPIGPGIGNPSYVDPAVQFQLDALRNDLNELKELIKAAQKYDAATGQPNCEDHEKVAKLKAIADIAGIDLSDVLIIPISKLKEL